MSKFTGILLGTMIVLALGAITAAQAAVTYDPILEWNGPFFRIINSPTIDQMVDDPVADIPFVQPYAVAAREHATDGRDVVYVVDTGHNRVQAFEANATYNTESPTWSAAAPIPVSTFNATELKIAGTVAAATNPYILPHSEVITVDGEVWTWVADSTAAGFTAANKVYCIDYDKLGAGTDAAPLIVFPTAALSSTSVVTIRYALTNEQTAAAGAFGIGDVDYGTGNGATPVLTHIDEAVTNGPSSWQMVRSIAVIANEALGTTDDVFLLDAADNSANQNEELFSYAITVGGTVSYVESYDDVLTTPYDVAVANGGPTEVAAAATESGAGDIVTAVSVVDASQVTGHTYTVALSGAVGTLTVTDATTGQVLVSAAANADIPPGALAFVEIPGVALTLDPAAAANFTSTITTTKAVADRYLFVADTGGDRIKVIAASDNAVTTTNDWLPGDVHIMTAQPAGADVGLVAGTDYYYTVATPVPQDYAVYTLTAPIKEGTLATITMDPAVTPVTWTRIDDLVTAGPTDAVYMVDWTTGKITFGDGVHGMKPTAGTTFSFTYTTTPDILRYGSSGTGPGRFSGPRGIAARWNPLQGVYDVYVADTGNSRMQKLAFHPADVANNIPARMEYICEWNTVSSALDLLSSPVDVAVEKDMAGGATGTIFLLVADQGNHRVVTYKDTDAVTGGGFLAPTWDALCGSHGNTLGLYTQVDGVAFLPNGNDLDIYACDGQRGIVTKYEETLTPTITLTFAGESALPSCFPPSSSYPFAFTTTNPPLGGHIDFYYDTVATFDPTTARLCMPENSVLATAATATWILADTPGGAPADRALTDGYYLFARMKDANGTLVASDATSSTELFCMDSTLLPGFRAVDRIDGDKTLYLQNGLERVVNLQLAYPDSVISVGIGGTFPFADLEVTGFTQGNGWEGTGYVSMGFYPSYSNTAGTFQVNTTINNSPTGLTGAGPFVMAQMSVRSKDNVLSASQRFLNGTISILQANSGMTDRAGDSPELSLWTTRDLRLRWGYLGDIATTGSGADSTVPHLAPLPDGKINFDDMMIFTLGWNGNGVMQDRISDIGPTEGSVPDLRPVPDGKWNVDDLLAFTLMYSWAAGEGYYKTNGIIRTDEPRPVALGEPVSGPAVVRSVSVLQAPKAGDLMTVDLNVDAVRDLSGALLNVGYDPARLELVSVENGGFLTGRSGSLFFSRSGQGWLEVSTSRLDQVQPGVDGSGTVARATFRILDENAGDLDVQYDLRSAAGSVLGRGLSKAGAYTGAPVGFKLYAAHPNPVRGNSNIVYSVPAASDLSLNVYDVTGRHVRTLYSGVREAGFHVAQFDGRDDSGNTLSGGIYFYRLTAGGKTATQKLTLTR